MSFKRHKYKFCVKIPESSSNITRAFADVLWSLRASRSASVWIALLKNEYSIYGDYWPYKILVSIYWWQICLQLLGYSVEFSVGELVTVVYCHINKNLKNKKNLHITLICVIKWTGLLFQIIHGFLVLLIFWKKKMFQNWGDYSDMSQNVAIYIVLAVDVLLLCWFGTQLAQHVRKTGLFLYLKCYEHYAYGDIHSSPWSFEPTTQAF